MRFEFPVRETSTPHLIGRMGFFSRFNVAFDNRRKRVVLETIEP